jgi:hypothetical protein
MDINKDDSTSTVENLRNQFTTTLGRTFVFNPSSHSDAIGNSNMSDLMQDILRDTMDFCEHLVSLSSGVYVHLTNDGYTIFDIQFAEKTSSPSSPKRNNNDGFGMFNEHPEHQRQENNGAKDDERDGRNAVDSQSSSSNHKNMHHGSGEHQHNMHHDLDHDSHSDGMQMQMQSQHDMRGGNNGHKSMDDWHHNVPHGIFSLSAPPISDVDEGDGSSLDFGFSSTSLLAPGGRFTN